MEAGRESRVSGEVAADSDARTSVIATSPSSALRPLMPNFAQQQFRAEHVSVGSKTDLSGTSAFGRKAVVRAQIDLVAVMWLGRGDGDLGSWRDLRSEASRAHNNRTAPYLIGTSMLADYLEEALTQLGKTFEDFEEHL
jgi:hypothetical protein